MVGFHVGADQAKTGEIVLKHHLSYADWSVTEYAAIANCVLRGKISRGQGITQLQAALDTLYSPSNIYLTNYGHHAISIALEMFLSRRPTCTEVLVPAYICPSVVKSVQKLGLQPVSVDVNDELNLDINQLEEAISASTLAVIAPHMYACPAQIEKIEQLCNAADVFLIDDAAQVAGVSYQGRMLGCFGDAGILSFAQSKTIVTGIRGSGGALIVSQSRHAELPRIVTRLPPASNRIPAMLDFFWNYLWHPWTGSSGYYLSRLLQMLGLDDRTEASCSQISNMEAIIALLQLEKLPDILQDKIRIAECYYQSLQKFPLITFPQYGPGRYLARVMLALPPHLNLQLFRNRLRIAGVETREGYTPYISAARRAENARQWSQRLFDVPAKPGMTDQEIDNICTVIGQCTAIV